MSTFDPTWPTGLVNLDVDYQQGNLNSTQLDTTMEINHYKFSNQTAMNGMHRYIQLPTDDNPSNHVLIPPYITTSSEVLLYNGLDGTYNAYFVPPNTAVPAGGIQLTRNEKPSSAQNGFSWLPGGILIQWGLVSFPGSGTTSFNTNTAAIYSINTTLIGNSSAENIVSITSSSPGAPGSFSWHFTGSTSYTAFYWIAIGR